VVSVSVLLPYRDAAATLAEAVDSVLAQRGVELELIAIDDGSRDHGRALIPRDERVVHVATGGIGIARALNAGLAAARAPLIARMDADDVAHPDRLRLQLELLAQDARLGAVGTRVRAVLLDGGAPGEGLARYVAWQNELVTADDHARELFVESPLCHPSVVLRRAALDEVGGWRDFDGPEDYELWLRLAAAGWRLAKVPAPLLDWRHVPGRLTFTDPRYALPRILATKAPFLAAALRARARPFVVWGAGPTGKRLARALEPHGARPAAFLDIDPRKLGGVARGAPILAPSADAIAGHTVVAAVGARGARDEIRAGFIALGGEPSALLLAA
jgi:hypothetical protein